MVHIASSTPGLWGSGGLRTEFVVCHPLAPSVSEVQAQAALLRLSPEDACEVVIILESAPVSHQPHAYEQVHRCIAMDA